MIQELLDLNSVRLSEDLSYRELERRTGISYRTLHELLNSEDPRPFDRTVHKIRRFLDECRASKSRRRARS